MKRDTASLLSSPGAPQKIEPRLIAITDRSLATAAETLARFERLARAARPCSVLFQLRDHELSGRERLEFGRALRALCTAAEQWFQVNDRCDLALLLGADGVHLGERSVSAADARRLLGPGAFVSRACHDAERELEAGVDAWVLSPIFAERKGREPLGVQGVRRLVERCRAVGEGHGAGGSGHTPATVFGLGAISAENAGDCRDAGAEGVAAMGAVLGEAGAEPMLAALGILR